MSRTPKDREFGPDKTEEVSRAPRTPAGANARYRNPHDLNFPPKLEEAYKKMGFKLRWVTCMDYKTRTFSNQRINHFLGMGGMIVTPKEVKEIDPGFLAGMIKYDYREDFADEDDRSRGQTVGIRKDDLIVMAIPLAYTEDKLAFNKQLVAEQLLAAEQKHTERGLTVDKNVHGSAKVKVRDGFFS